MATRSRLSRRMENQTKKSLFITVVLVAVLIFLLVKFGIPFIANVGLFISNLRESNDPKPQNEAVFVPAPVLHPTVDATFSAQITIEGTVPQKNKIQLFVNGKEVEETEPEDNNTFTFKEISLKPGENTIQAKAVTNNKKESDFSNSITILHKKDKPKLSISSPDEGKTFSKDENSTKVTGETDPEVKVTVNGFWAIVDSEGKYSYNLSLQNGENTIKVVATDEAGNTTEVERKVTYNP